MTGAAAGHLVALAAEVITAALLVAGGIAVLVSGGDATLATIAIGALLYTAVNSAGSYADRSQWPIVVMFAVLAAVTAAANPVAIVLAPGGP